MEKQKQDFLNKPTLTGEEIARFMLHSWADEFMQVTKGIYEPKIIANSETMEILLDKLDYNNMEIARHFLNIRDWVSKNFPVASAHIQQAQGNLDCIIRELENIEIFENISHFMDELPLIVTNSQYNRYKKEKKEQIIKNAKLYNLLEIIERGINYYVELLETSPRKKNPLREIKKLYMKETLDHNHLIKENSIKKWDFLKRYTLIDFYDCFKKPDIDSLDEFMEDFKPLYQKIFEEIFHKMQLKEGHLFEKVYTSKELYECNIFGFKEVFCPSSSLMNNYNAIKNGVAIIEENSLTELSKTKIDKNGDYIPPNIKVYLSKLGINAYTNGEEGEHKAQERKADYQAIKESYYFIQGYNRGLKIISEMYNLKDVEVFAVEQEAIEDYIKELNNKFISLKNKIENSYHENKSEQQEKLKTLNNIFEVIHMEKLQTSKKNINQFTKILEKMELGENKAKAINLLSEWIYK